MRIWKQSDDDELVLGKVQAGELAEGLADKHYVHEQSNPSAIWEITHNLGKYPSVTAFDANGNEIVPEVVHSDINTTNLYFNSVYYGSAVLN